MSPAHHDESEPGVETWDCHGRACKLVVTHLGHYCGYAQTSIRDLDRLERLVETHGGLTYGPDEEGWVGFDCAHAFDICVDEDGEPLSEIMAHYPRDDPLSRVWTRERVRAELAFLVGQLDALEEMDSAVE